MRHWFLWPALTTISLATLGVAQAPTPACNEGNAPFCDSTVALPAGWRGPSFRLSQDYPQLLAQEGRPWLAYSPRTQSSEYMNAVLRYFYEGQLRADPERSFAPAANRLRRWYHAPWQDFGPNGREPLQGLTRERSSRAFELTRQQTSIWNNYAVGFYNAPGGYAFGRVWANRGSPNPAFATFPEGTVAAKLLFTTASDAEVPFLRGAPTWRAYIYKDVNKKEHALSDERAVLPVRLLQIDIAVKDGRAPTGVGWIFGTFIYGGGNANHRGAGWWNVQPVGVMWGNDPNYAGGAPMAETKLNAAVQLMHYGYEGRLNGPVDNPKSSCMSCHATAQIPQAAMLPPDGRDPRPWFQNLRSGQPFTPGGAATDYSLQLSTGIESFRLARQLKRASPAAKALFFDRLRDAEQVPARDGGLPN